MKNNDNRISRYKIIAMKGALEEILKGVQGILKLCQAVGTQEATMNGKLEAQKALECRRHEKGTA